MLQQQRVNNRGEKYVIGPTGAPLTLSDLPLRTAFLVDSVEDHRPDDH